MSQNPFPAEESDLLQAEKAVRAAMATLRRLPRGRNSRPAAHLATIWPELANLPRHDDSPPRHRPIAPSPREIDFMDQVLVALLPLSADQRRVLAARGCGASFRRLAAYFGLSHTTLRRHHRHALAALVTHLRHPDLPEGMDW